MHLLLDRHVECSQKLFSLYEDKDGLRKEEVAALSGPNEMREFYARLKQIKDFHKRHPNEVTCSLSYLKLGGCFLCFEFISKFLLLSDLI